MIRSELHFCCSIENKVWAGGKTRKLVGGYCSNLDKKIVVKLETSQILKDWVID